MYLVLLVNSACLVKGTPLLSTRTTKNLCFSIDLHLTFTFDLDKDIDVKLRRMFFYDNVTKSKLFSLRQNTTLAEPNTNYVVLQKTAYIKVWQTISHEATFFHLLFKNLKLS